MYFAAISYNIYFNKKSIIEWNISLGNFCCLNTKDKSYELTNHIGTK